MKKIGIFFFAVLFSLSFVACDKKGEGSDNGGEGNANNTENTNGATADNANTNPAPGTSGATANNPQPTPGTSEATGAPASNLPATAVSYPEESFNFGEIKEGEVVSHVFKFTNTGDHPFQIDNVKPSCGCTTPDWSKEPIEPGKEGFVKVEFNSKGKKGVQNKSVTIRGNTNPPTKILRFSGEVVAPE